MTYRPVKLTTEDLHEVKHLMGGALTLLSLWSLLSLSVDSVLLISGAMLAIAYALVKPAQVSRIPQRVWRFAGPVMVFIIAADFLLNLPEFIPSLVRMVVLLLIYRNLAPRSQREDLQLILLCLFCLVISGVMTVSLLFAFQILLFTPIAMALLFVICLLDRGEETEPYKAQWMNFRWSRLAKRVWLVLDLSVLSLGAILFGFVVMVSSVLFILTPRFNLDKAIPFLQVETSAMTGFSEEVALGDVSSVQNDDSVAVRIDVPSLQSLNQSLYWRMLVLDQYKEGRFSMSDSLSSYLKPRSLREHNPILLSRPVPAKGERWTFYVEGGVSRYLPVSGRFRTMRFQAPQSLDFWDNSRLYRLDQVDQGVFSFQLEDLQFDARVQVGEFDVWKSFVEAFNDSESDDAKYPQTTLALPLKSEETAYLGEVNEQILSGIDGSVLSYSEALTNYLWQRYSYSLSPDGQVLFQNVESSPDEVVNWLQKGSRGHCELFASAFVLLAREAGFPARLVVGFAGGTWNSVEDYFMLRNSDAHAWVEILDRESKEWVRVDPTPGNADVSSDGSLIGSFGFETGWNAWIDSLRIQWYRRVVNFEQQDQVEMAMSIKDMAQAFTEEFSARAKEVVAEFKAWIAQPFSAGNLLRGLIVVLFVLCLYFLWCSRYWVLRLVFLIFRRSNALDPVRKQAGQYLRRLNERHGETLPVRLEADLQALRFGPEVNSELAKPVFGRARKALRSKQLNKAA
ncbi:MAG: DUF3488 and transglutaminase-like domain-containing protein [Verrucomicrobiota bacterium]